MVRLGCMKYHIEFDIEFTKNDAPGLFIALEGLDASGKSTQIKLLKSYLEKKTKHEVIVTREPGGTLIADQIRKILLSGENKNLTALTELFLYEASRSQHVSEIIKPALKKGKTVLCDRFFDATTVYQGIARGLGMALCKKLNKLATENLFPHLTLLIDCPVEVGLSRSKQRLSKEKSHETRFEEENLQFHKKVRAGYLKLAQLEPKRIKVINGNQRTLKIHNDICKVVDRALKK